MNGHIPNGPKRLQKWHEADLKKLLKDFEGYEKTKGLATFHPGNYCLMPAFAMFREKLYNFKFREDDVIIMTFPKCGTTWTQEVVWTMRHNPNLDIAKASIPVNVKAPFLDSDMFNVGLSEDNPFAKNFKEVMPDKDPNDGMMIQMADMMPEKRVIKSHLPFSFYHPSMLEKCKVIFVTRNPHDSLVSYYQHSRLMTPMAYVGTFEDFVNYFVEDKVLYGPFWENMREVLDRYEHPNLLCLKYEEMLADPLKEIRKIDQFIGTGLSAKQMENIKEYTSFKEMKKRGEKEIPVEFLKPEIAKETGGFFRKGQSGDGKIAMTEIQKTKMDIWIKRNTIGKKQQYSKIVSF